MPTNHTTNSRLKYLDTIQAWNLSQAWRVRWDEMRCLRKGKKLEYILSIYKGDHLFFVSGWNQSFRFQGETNALNSSWNSVFDRVVNRFQIGLVLGIHLIKRLVTMVGTRYPTVVDNDPWPPPCQFFGQLPSIIPPPPLCVLSLVICPHDHLYKVFSFPHHAQQRATN